MDIASFQIIRSPRPTEAYHAIKENVVVDPNLMATTEKLAESEGNSGIAKIASSNGNSAIEEVQIELEHMAGRITKKLPDPIPATMSAIEQDVYRVLVEIGEFLFVRDDRVPSAEWMEKLNQLQQKYLIKYGQDPWNDAIKSIRTALYVLLLEEMLTKNIEMIANRTRWLILSILVLLADRWELTAETTWRILNTVVPHFPDSIQTAAGGEVQVFPNAKVKLVREASISDSYVVRSEWRCYVPGDLAAVKNVLPGESREHTQKHLQELESTQTTETQTSTFNQSETQTQDQSELSSETSAQMHNEINGRVQTELQQGWGTGSIKVSGGVEGRVSLDQAERHATRVARSSVAKAVSKVDTMTREARTRRELSRHEDTLTEKLANDGEKPVRGIYRWLDRIDRYQIVRFPERLQLEFQIPEPGEYLRWRSRNSTSPEGIDKPPEWDLEYKDLKHADQEKLFELASHYRATGLPVLPDQYISVLGTIKAEAQNVPKDDGTRTVEVPLAAAECELLVPNGYEAESMSYRARAAPVFGNWVGEREDEKSWDDYPGWHFGMLSLMVGGTIVSSDNKRDQNMLHSTRTVGLVKNSDPFDIKNIYPFFEDSVKKLQLSDPPGHAIPLNSATGRVKVAIQGIGVSSVQASLSMTCKRNLATENTWRQSVYDALFDAWSQWKREWDNAQSRNSELQMIFGDGSATRMAEIMKNEMKRQVIAWLLDRSPFNGEDALKPPGLPPEPSKPMPWQEIDFDKARVSAPTIQFLEQAFEWGNMGYVLYPYYWANREHWDDLNDVQSASPDLERFLKAGSARVVVPVRPAMTQAVLHWLVYQVPFLGRPMPLPGDPLYLSLAQEVRDLTQPPPDGIPGESWEARVGTTFLWLQDTAELPHNESGTLGTAPNIPVPAICPNTEG